MKNRLVKYGDSLFYYKIKQELKGCSSVLDIGCGWDSPLGKIKYTGYSVGIDIYKPVIEKSKRRKIHSKYILSDVCKVSTLFKLKSFDAVVAFDLIEHLDKKDGLTLLSDMEKIARKRVIVLTPQGYTHQDEYDQNPHQLHKSGWIINDFKKRNYKVYGLRGLRIIRGDCATIKYKPWFLWGLLSFLSEPIVYFLPKWGYHILGVKTLI